MLTALARALPCAGWQACVGVLADRRFKQPEVAIEARRLGLPVEIIPCDGRWDRHVAQRLRSLVDSRRIDVIHAHGYKADFYAAAAGRPRGGALVATCHNWPNKRLTMRAYAAVDRLVLRSFDEVATASHTVSDVLRRWGVRVTLIENGVDTEQFQNAEPALREELAGTGGKVVGFVGRMVAAKGGAVLLEAAKGVCAVEPDTRFVFVGEGPSRAEWQALAERLGLAENTIFTGVRRDMPGIYASFDMMVLPSYEENMPMCLLEAMAAGAPVIATKVGAIPELIVPGATGEVVEPGDASGLAKAILNLIRDPEQARRLGANGQARATERFSASAKARQYAALFGRALAAAGGKHASPNTGNKRGKHGDRRGIAGVNRCGMPQ